jgi:hypothetical protein
VDLTTDEVRSLAGSLGIEIADEDLQEITHRHNALQDALGSLEHPDLDSVEPLSIFGLGREG